jgi:hypothetical protein
MSFAAASRGFNSSSSGSHIKAVRGDAREITISLAKDIFYDMDELLDALLVVGKTSGIFSKEFNDIGTNPNEKYFVKNYLILYDKLKKILARMLTEYEYNYRNLNIKYNTSEYKDVGKKNATDRASKMNNCQPFSTPQPKYLLWKPKETNVPVPVPVSLPDDVKQKIQYLITDLLSILKKLLSITITSIDYSFSTEYVEKKIVEIRDLLRKLMSFVFTGKETYNFQQLHLEIKECDIMEGGFYKKTKKTKKTKTKKTKKTKTKKTKKTKKT